MVTYSSKLFIKLFIRLIIILLINAHHHRHTHSSKNFSTSNKMQMANVRIKISCHKNDSIVNEKEAWKNRPRAHTCTWSSFPLLFIHRSPHRLQYVIDVHNIGAQSRPGLDTTILSLGHIIGYRPFGRCACCTREGILHRMDCLVMTPLNNNIAGIVCVRKEDKRNGEERIHYLEKT